ncbi:MAG: tripartite tricarboxylate transporter substrate binding protein [Xanthobacteraceae bacterium]|nr:tripartite tricarboxylate transporter substrate binding protein [Xanthobacteraceae bacterium]
MERSRRQVLQAAAAAGASALAVPEAFAQSYPAKPVRLIIPFGAGGPTDVFGRLAAQKLSDSLGKQFFVENIVGASGNIGTARAAKLPADGYTMLLIPTNFVVNPALLPNTPYDAIKDFDPVTVAVTSPMIISVHPSVSAQNVRDLIGLIKANPGKYSYASGGVGSPGHLVGEQFRVQLGLDLVHVPFQSAGLAVQSAIGNHTPICIVSPAPTVPQVREGKLRALAVTRKVRSQALPMVPTMTEAGHPDIEGENWFGFVMPAGTPREIVLQLNREIVQIVALPDVKEKLAGLGFEPVGNSPEEFAEQIRRELPKWAKVVREANIKAE